MTSHPAADFDWKSLAARLVAKLQADGLLDNERLEAAFRQTPRHRFVPDADPAEAYEPHTAVRVKTAGTEPLSTMSAPHLQAQMLHQAAVEPGMRVLEIGTGGVNAAMLRTLVGDSGHVTTMDIDQDVIAQAQQGLTATGHHDVDVVCADAELGYRDNAPYDRIIVTCGAWDIPPAWPNQLADDGKIVVPLRMAGVTRSLTLEQSGANLVSTAALVCGFVRIQGAGAFDADTIPFGDTGAVLSFDDGSPAGVASEFDLSTNAADTVAVSEVRLGAGESFEPLQLWLAARHPGFGRIRSWGSTFDFLTEHHIQLIDLAVSDGSEVAAICLVRAAEEQTALGALGLTPGADALVDDCVSLVNQWNTHYRNGPDPTVTITHHGDDHVPGKSYQPNSLQIRKRHSTVTITWPPAT